MLTYQCDQCGASCRQHIVEADALDVMREPRIAAESEPLDGNGRLPVIETTWMLACGPERPCSFLRPDNKCDIYSTRPIVCVALQPGDAQCQPARQNEGLADLDPVLIDRVSTINMLSEALRLETDQS